MRCVAGTVSVRTELASAMVMHTHLAAKLWPHNDTVISFSQSAQGLLEGARCPMDDWCFASPGVQKKKAHS